jgi:hypothetical protein
MNPGEIFHQPTEATSAGLSPTAMKLQVSFPRKRRYAPRLKVKKMKVNSANVMRVRSSVSSLSSTLGPALVASLSWRTAGSPVRTSLSLP